MPVGGDLGQWHEHEGARVHFPVRNAQARGIDDLAAVQQQVQIQGAGTPAHIAHSPEFLLDALQQIQQVFRRQAGFDQCRGIGVVRLSGRADGGGPVQAGVAHEGDVWRVREALQPLEQDGRRITQIAAEPDGSGYRHVGHDAAAQSADFGRGRRRRRGLRSAPAARSPRSRSRCISACSPGSADCQRVHQAPMRPVSSPDCSRRTRKS